MYKVVITDHLTKDEQIIREEVFLKEQKFTIEFDDIDDRAKHMVLYAINTTPSALGGKEWPVACCRYFRGEAEGEYVVGRLAVRKEFRGKHLGERMIHEVENAVVQEGGRKLSLSAQVRVKDFYEKQGFVKCGEIYYDEYCEHVRMEKRLERST